MNNEFFTIVQLPKHFDPRGNLTVAEEEHHVPFQIESVQWSYGMQAVLASMPKRTVSLGQYLVVPLSGSFTLTLLTGTTTEKIFMNHPFEAVYITKGIDFEISDCASGTVFLTLSDHHLV